MTATALPFPATVNADPWTNLKESISSLWEKGKQASTGQLITRETFANEVPVLVAKHGRLAISGLKISDLSDGTATYSVMVSHFNDPETGKPMVLWIDKVEGTEIVRYADLNGDGELDAITLDGAPPITQTLLNGLVTGNKQMFDAKLAAVRQKAARYQPMYEADYSRVYFLICRNWPQVEHSP